MNKLNNIMKKILLARELMRLRKIKATIEEKNKRTNLAARIINIAIDHENAFVNFICLHIINSQY